MQKQVIRIGIYIGKVILNIIYFFIKLLPTKNKIIFLSRQSNTPSLDFKLIENEILKRREKVKIEFLCKVLKKDDKSRLEYCFYILKCMYHIATSKVCILDGYSIPISILKHKKKLKIIQIWHASGALKKFGYQSLNKKEGRSEGVAKVMNMHKNYSYIMAPSYATAKFYEEAFNVKKENVLINGLPRIDYILETKDIGGKITKFYKQYPNFKNKKTILYVPTFRKTSNSATGIKNLIKNINFKKYNLIVKLHPLDKSQIAKKYQVNKQYNTFDLIKIADYVITDYSAVAFETSILNKPLYFYVYDIDKYEKTRGLNINLFEEMPNCTSKEVKKIINSIEKDNYNFEELMKFREKYMGKISSNNTEKLVNFIFKYIYGDDKNKENKGNVNGFSQEELVI